MTFPTDNARARTAKSAAKSSTFQLSRAPGETRVGRFGWKDQQASLLSFSGDAYLNEMGITNRLFPDEVTKLCNTAPEPNGKPGPDGLADVDRFARFLRSTKAPARDQVLAATDKAKRGSELFDKIRCSICHVRDKVFHPFGDFLLHDVGPAMEL